MTRRDWIQSYSSKVVTPRDLKPEQVSLEDIAHALAQKVRFNGHLQRMGYSVAQHCVIGTRAIAGPFKLAFLLHEVSEVYLPDIPAPLKPYVTVEIDKADHDGDQMVITWTELERLHADAVFEALGLSPIRPLIDSPQVRDMDLRLLMTEKRDLAGPEPQPWGISAEPLDQQITECWTPSRAAVEFSNLFSALVSP